MCRSCLAPLVAQSTPHLRRRRQRRRARAPVVLPKDYVIGAEDVLNVVFWSAKELSAEVLVRPDGKISLPILNDLPAAG